MRRLTAAAVLALAMLSGGCAREEVLQLEDRYVSLRVHAYRYDHQDVRVPPGRILFGIANDGPEPTNFRIRRGERDVFDGIATMEPGERGVGYATLKPGVYTMYSSVGRNEALGEYGTLTVSRSRATPPPAQRTETPRGLTRP